MFSFRLGGSIPIIIYESRCVIRLNFLILITSRRNIKFTAFRVKKKMDEKWWYWKICLQRLFLSIRHRWHKTCSSKMPYRECFESLIACLLKYVERTGIFLFEITPLFTAAQTLIGITHLDSLDKVAKLP